ncbi:MAG: hypothetical protein JWR44_2888 [Hymenobacter sp.]|nr:hypothetical protein [Hymenobacter sp.]
MTYFFLSLWLWFVGPSPTVPLLEPLRIAEQFVAPGGWPAMKNYLCCEAASQAKRQTLGQQIPPHWVRSSQLLQQGPTTAVVAVELRDSLRRSDVYLHFSKEAAGWKLRAIRSLAMTHLGPPMVGILAAMPPAEVADYDRKHPDAHHAFALGNLRLWTSADADIKAHFQRNEAAFQEAVRLLQTRRYFNVPADSSRAGEAAANADPAVRSLLQRLFISRVRKRDTDCSTCLEFLIGGMTDNTVGLLFEPNAAAVPPMSPDGIIVLKPLGDGWYLYKTT